MDGWTAPDWAGDLADAPLLTPRLRRIMIDAVDKLGPVRAGRLLVRMSQLVGPDGGYEEQWLRAMRDAAYQLAAEEDAADAGDVAQDNAPADDDDDDSVAEAVSLCGTWRFGSCTGPGFAGQYVAETRPLDEGDGIPWGIGASGPSPADAISELQRACHDVSGAGHPCRLPSTLGG